MAFRLYGIPKNHIDPSFPPPVKFTWNMQTLYRCLWGTIPFPVETNCPHLERQPPFYTIVGHIPVPGEFHEGRLAPAQPLNPSQHTLTAPSRGQAFACKSLLTPCRCATSPFQGDTACAIASAGTSVASISSEISLTLRCGGWCRPSSTTPPLLRFSKKILLTFRHGG